MIEDLKYKINKKGGFVNAHAHLDRANTATFFSKEEQYRFLKEKWRLVDRIKKQSGQIDYAMRINKALHDQIDLGVSSVCSFIDIDSTVGTKAIEAAFELSTQKRIKDRIDFVIATQTLKGVIDPDERRIINQHIEKADIIGSLPGADKGQEEEHLDVVMAWAKMFKKRLHVHVDQLNTPAEKETELLARKTMEWGMENRVTAVHSISLACHPITYRNEVYKMSKDAGLSFITCPSAWIDHPRREDLAPIHNSITPVDELLSHGLTVAIGSDNIHDLYKPYCNGDMMFELRMLLEACKIYDDEALINIATTNGRKVLGLDD